MQSITAVHPVKLNIEFDDGRHEKFRVVLWSSGAEVHTEYGDVSGHTEPTPWIVLEGDIVSWDQVMSRDDVMKSFLTADGE